MYRYQVYSIVILCAFLGFISEVRAQALSQHRIFLKGQTINAARNVDDWLSLQQTIKYPTQLLVQFDNLPDEQVQKEMKYAGVQLVSYLPERSYIAIVQQPLTQEFFELNKIRFITQVSPSWKIADDLKTNNVKPETEIAITISFVDGISKNEVDALLTLYQGRIISDRLSSLGYVIATIPKRALFNLANEASVTYISSKHDDVPLNQTSKSLERIKGPTAPSSLGGSNLTGDGVVMGIGDNFAGSYHIDLKDRVINYIPTQYDYHGLHISGIAGGAGIADIRGQGVATRSILSTHFFSEVLNATPSIAQSQGVTITNNSYSARAGNCNYTGTYDNLSVVVDDLCNSLPNVLHVFASANNGRFDCAPYPVGFGTVAGGFQPSKNSLVVGSVNYELVDAESSSRGPVLDGRIKPELVASGAFVYSTTGTESYFYQGGTSMASPGVAGAAALLTEAYKVKNSNKVPRADLLKALLVNGTTDIGNKGPDYRFGFGLLNLEESLTMLDSNRYFEKNVSNGNETTETIVVPANTKKLKVLLYWHDVAASPVSSKQLVNDLDLSVTTPTNTTHLPLVLDAAPSNILNLAKESEDHLNNIEQVTIDAPAAGSYTLKVKGTNMPSGSRRYILVYNFITDEGFAYPQNGSQVPAGDTLHIYWDDFSTPSSYTLEYTINAGGLWNVIDNNVPADTRVYKWGVPDNISSGRCLLRLTKNNVASSFTSETFVINAVPKLELSKEQCPGYIQIEWPAIPNATAYEVLWKDGFGMEPVDTVATLNYTFKGLNTTQEYYMAIRPIIDGLGGYRSLAVKRTPYDGDCNGNISDFDLSIDKVIAPGTGRLQTSSALEANENLSVSIHNLDNIPCNSYTLHYRINGGAWMSQAFTDAIAAKTKKTITVGGLDLSAVGDYVIDVAIENTENTDPVSVNDSTVIFISQLSNPTLTLDVSETFDGVGAYYITKDTIGVGTNRRWDFSSLPAGGRLRNYVLNNVTISGGRSISLDAQLNGVETKNSFLGTFNLANYNATSDEVRVEFDYIVHGIPKQSAGNVVMVRGADDKLLQELYQLKTDEESVGTVQNSGSLSVSDVLLKNNDNFSTSSQILFSQQDTSVIGRRNFGNGVTFDNVRIYTVQNDLQLLSVNSPESTSCGVTGPVPLNITIRNGVSQTLSNIQLSYRLDGGAIVTETISSIDGKQTLDYTFNQNIDITASGAHTIDVWVFAAGDSYRNNDSINNYKLRNQPLITQFPYLEDFENNDGFWYSAGANASWEYGEPTATKISKAASGTKAWVTNLTGNYNDYETSYLYFPCFDISSLQQATMSFKMAQDIENCENVVCDGAHIEYSVDGESWQRLGGFREGENWYTDSNFLVWNTEGRTDWYTASLPLPDTLSNVQFRFVFRSDPAGTFEGLGIDDVQIYSERFYQGTDDVLSVSPNPTVTGKICIEWAANGGEKMQIAITDIAGKLVYATETTAIQGYNKTCLRTPMFSSGMYFLRIIIGEKEHKRRIVYLRR